MEVELLNLEKVKRLRKKLGLTSTKELIAEVGVTRTAGYSLFRDGILPKNQAIRKRVLKKLANMFGTHERQLVVCLVAKDAA